MSNRATLQYCYPELSSLGLSYMEDISRATTLIQLKNVGLRIKDRIKNSTELDLLRNAYKHQLATLK